MPSHQSVIDALTALNSTISAAIDRLKNPPVGPTPPPVEDTSFLDTVLSGIQAANDTLGRALSPVPTEPPAVPGPIIDTSTGSGSKSPSPVASRAKAGATIICPVCGRTYTEGSKHTCPV